ncbi:unnamed protein product [Gongylonema pulchrum]|uniref:Geranylgeranyl transferase type-2 subunit alpha n=1 Tax=Gongylonema pulchrum TaxID=637853 RepID=A0A3P7QFZ7_9BILA|nr:unnamed protein product [Gongylonema pulchrum]
MQRLSKPDIAKELTACETYLKMDGRNFHCWDYRRQVAQFGAQSAEDELKFSNRLINANFSNYSSWHYRSTLLPSLFPDEELTIERSVLDDEYRKLENAFFTDPEDQSAWIYAEWLLLSEPKRKKGGLSDICVLGLVFDINHDKMCGCSDSFLSITFNSAVKIANINDFLILTLKNGQRWTPTTVTVSLFSSYIKAVNLSDGYVNFDEIYHFYHIKRKPIAESRREIIEKFMDNCEKLLKELEFERKRETMKWPLYMYTLTLLELKPVEMHEKILHNLELLAKEIDAQRCGMYEDMARNLQINEKLRQKFGNKLLIDTLFKKTDGVSPVGELNLEDMGLKRFSQFIFPTIPCSLKFTKNTKIDRAMPC